MNKQAVKSISDALGADAIQSALDVSRHSIRYARTNGAFPASWYAPLYQLCSQKGIDCPLDAFNMRANDSDPAGGCRSDRGGDAA